MCFVSNLLQCVVLALFNEVSFCKWLIYLCYLFAIVLLSLRYIFASHSFFIPFKNYYIMSKGNFLTNNVSGKLGAMVFFRRKGEQVTRSYVKPADAKTRSQGVRRSGLSNIIRVYQASPSFFKSAFENKPSNQSDYNALVSRNLGREPLIAISKEMSASGGGVVAPYIISDGSLQPIIVSGIGVDARTNIAVGSAFTIDETTTIGALTDVVLASNTFLIEGDQLSYLSIEQYNYLGYPRLRSRKYELVLRRGDTMAVRDVMPDFAMSVVDGFLGHGPFMYSGAFAYVYSRKVNNKLLVSKQSLIVTSDSLYAPYTTNEALTRAAESYGTVGDVFLSPDSERDGVAIIPSVLPEVSSVSLVGNALVTGVTPSQRLAGVGSIPASGLVAIGSNLDAVEEISLTYGGLNSTSTAVNGTVVVPVDVLSNSISNTAVIAVDGVRDLTHLAITIGGVRVWSWDAYTSSGGGDDF